MIDASIPLSYQPIAVKDPMQSAAQVLQMKSLMQQQQLGGLQIQEQQLALDRTKSLNDAYKSALVQSPDGSIDIDPGKLTQALGTAGHGSAIPTVLEAITKMQQSRATLHETLGKVAAAQQDFAGSIGSAVKSANNDPHLFLTLAQHAAATKSIDPGLVNQAAASVAQALAQDPSGESARQIAGQIADHWVAASPGQQKIINERMTAESRQQQAKTTADKFTAELPGIKSNNLLKGLEAAAQTVPQNQADWDTWRATLPAELQPKVPAMYSPAAAEAVRQMAVTPYQAKELAGQAAGRANTAQHDRVIEGFEGQRVGLEAQRVRLQGAEQGLRQKTFDATYGALVGTDGKPLEGEAAKAVAMTDPLAVAIANYQKAPMAGGSRGPGAGIMRKVYAINPDYNENKWTQQKQTLLDYSPAGKTGTALGRMSTALGHLGVLDQAAEALNNSNLPMLNAIANKLGAATGSDKATVFKTIVHRLGPEIEGAYLAGGGTAGERGTTEADFNPDLGYKQIKSNIATSANLFRSKIGTNEYEWKSVMGSQPMPFLLSPDAEKTMQRVTGTTSGGGGAAAAAGGPPPLPSSLSGQDLGKTYTAPNGTKVKITDVNPKNPAQFRYVEVK